MNNIEKQVEYIVETYGHAPEEAAKKICALFSVSGSTLTTKDTEKAKLVIHYLNNLDSYSCKDMSYWDKLQETDLKDKDGNYIQAIDEMIDDCINNGEVAFKQKYGID